MKSSRRGAERAEKMECRNFGFFGEFFINL
jgi:hypothetical protein